MDNKIATISKKILSDGAYRIYGYLSSFQNGRRITDNYILTALDISQKTLTKYKKQLRDLDLVVVEQIVGKEYDIYIGSTSIPASKVKEYWNELDNTQDKPITLEDLKILRKLNDK